LHKRIRQISQGLSLLLRFMDDQRSVSISSFCAVRTIIAFFFATTEPSFSPSLFSAATVLQPLNGRRRGHYMLDKGRMFQSLSKECHHLMLALFIQIHTIT